MTTTNPNSSSLAFRLGSDRHVLSLPDVDQAYANALILRIGGLRSAWVPCPVLQRILHLLLRSISQTERMTLPVTTTLAPLLPLWLQDEFGFSTDFSLNTDNTNQPDPEYGEAVLYAAAELALSILNKRGMPLVLQMERVGGVSYTDRKFLQVLISRSNGQVIIDWQDRHIQQRVKSAARVTMQALQRGKYELVLAAVLSGVNRAILSGLYREALRKLRVAVWLFQRHGRVPKELIERMGFAYSALGCHRQVVQCQQWLIEHAQNGKERSSALISKAVYLFMGEQSPQNIREARRLFAQAHLQIRTLKEPGDRVLMRSLLLNSTALILYRRGRLQAALAKCERAYHVLNTSRSLHKFAGQASIVCTNATRIALVLEDSQLAAFWTDRLAELANEQPQILEQCSKMYGRLGQWEEAAKWAGRALQSVSSLPRLYLHRALCYYHMAQSENALSDLAAAEQLAPEDERIYLLRATVLEESDDLAGALENYQMALALVPGHSAAWADLARVHWSRGACKESLAALQTAIELAPEHMELQELMTQLMQEQETLNPLGGDSGDSTDPFPV